MRLEEAVSQTIDLRPNQATVVYKDRSGTDRLQASAVSLPISDIVATGTSRVQSSCI